MNYYLMTQSGHNIQPEHFIRLLSSQWPTATIKIISDPQDNHAVEFQLSMDSSTLDGALNREGSGLIYTGAIRDCAEFALWYRAASPEGQPYLMFDEGYNRHISLRADTTTEEIVRALTD
jgi:hypothetical protein